MTSITEVARRAGVSTATASRVMAAADYPVSQGTRQRVLDAALALDYVPNALARGLQKSRIAIVGVIVHDITDPYFSEVVRGIEDAAAVDGHLVITCSSDRSPDRENSYVRLLRSMRAAAVIFAGSGMDDPARNQELGRHLVGLRENGAAIVHLSPHAFGDPEVGVDNAAGISAMVAALGAMGHERIAFLAGPTALYVARERLAGYRQAVAELALAHDRRLVVPTTFDSDGGAAAIDRLLASGAEFTAICCANDLLALGAIRRLRQLGLGVPGDVSVAGFDDITVAAITAPSLSTVRLPLRELGGLGYAHAVRQLAGDDPEPILVPTRVILRDSTAAPAATTITKGPA